MKVDINLNGKIALVTGSTRGIGKAIADCFLNAGAKVVITGTNKAAIDNLKAKNTSEFISYMQVDFTDDSSVKSFLADISLLGKIDILVNNAGINRINLNDATTDEDYDLLNKVNLKVPYLLCREVSKLMKQNGYGRIVNVTSIWSSITRSGRSLYTATKTGLAGLTKTLAVELAPYNILVNAVAPGFTATELTASTNTPEEIAKIEALIPIGRFAKPAEIAALILFLSSDLNSYMTAQNIIIDGGYTNV